MTTQEIKSLGKVKKIFAGLYRYEGKNFSVEFDNACGYWAIDDSSITNDVQVDFYQHDRKTDLVWEMQCIDADIEEKKQ